MDVFEGAWTHAISTGPYDVVVCNPPYVPEPPQTYPVATPGPSAFDRSPAAVECARLNALEAGVDIDVFEGAWTHAISTGPYDVVVCNPPYVPEPPQTYPVATPG
ncbi:methyltransferase, partial [Mycobacterium hackensackense]|nr:methyltransferase [Mycobacterium hackensackense]